MSEVKYAVNRLINSVWTLSYTENPDNTITILTYDRENEIGYEREAELPRCRLSEADGRVVIAATITDVPCMSYDWKETPKTEKAVSNSKHVFSYN